MLKRHVLIIWYVECNMIWVTPWQHNWTQNPSRCLTSCRIPWYLPHSPRKSSLVTPWKLAQLAPPRLAKWPWHAMALIEPPKRNMFSTTHIPIYSIYIHVWYIYLQNLVIFRANVGKYSSTMEQMGYESPNPSEALGDSSGFGWMDGVLFLPFWRSHVWTNPDISRSYHMISAYHISK